MVNEARLAVDGARGGASVETASQMIRLVIHPPDFRAVPFVEGKQQGIAGGLYGGFLGGFIFQDACGNNHEVTHEQRAMLRSRRSRSGRPRSLHHRLLPDNLSRFRFEEYRPPCCP